MKFIIKSDAVFEAENIDDALQQLSKYFADISNQGIFIESGYINVLRLYREGNTQYIITD